MDNNNYDIKTMLKYYDKAIDLNPIKWEYKNVFSTAMPVKKKAKKKMVNKKKATGVSMLAIQVLSNGYMITSTDDDGARWVFQSFEKMIEFMKKYMQPTGIQSDFIEQL